jgi:hypothetical protein
MPVADLTQEPAMRTAQFLFSGLTAAVVYAAPATDLKARPLKLILGRQPAVMVTTGTMTNDVVGRNAPAVMESEEKLEDGF